MRILCVIAVALSACTGDLVVVADADASRPDASTDIGIDAVDDTPPADACIVHPWGADGGDAGAIVTNVRQFISNCHHNENTDLITYHGAIYLIHRTYSSQVLSPDARLHLLRSTDQGQTFTEIHQFSYPGRDIRDPKLMIVGDELRVYSLSRLPGFMAYDLGTDTLTTVARSSDGNGTTWTDPTPVYESGWSFWREVQVGARFYAAAYQDGDRSIIFLGSDDGLSWTRLATVFSDQCRIPLEPEPMFFPDGRVVIGIRMDDGDNYLDDGHEMLCVADPPYTNFTCPSELPGRLDGPLTFMHGTDRYVIARAHLPLVKKRTVIYRFTGNLHDATGVGLELIATLPSAGDTSYAGLTWLTPDRALISWYTSNPALGDVPWWYGSLNATDIFLGTIDFANPEGPGVPFARDGAVGPCRPLDDGGLLFPDAPVDVSGP